MKIMKTVMWAGRDSFGHLVHSGHFCDLRHWVKIAVASVLLSATLLLLRLKLAAERMSVP